MKTNPGQQGGPPTVLKKYQNRRIYDPTRNTHVTLNELADRVKSGENIRIVDNESGEDITHVIMGQVLLETLKERPDYLPLDLVILMIRAQDVVVRDFLFNGIPQAFQMYMEAQRRYLSGMNWMSPGFPGGPSPIGNMFPSFFTGSQPSSGGYSTPQPSPVGEDLKKEIDRLKEEVQGLKNRRGRSDEGEAPTAASRPGRKPKKRNP